MPDLSKTFAAIDEEIAGLMSTGESDGPVTLKLSPEAFMHYVQEQITLVKAGEDVAKRIAHVRELVDLAKKYDWEEDDTMSVAVYSGDLSVQSMSRWAEKMENGFAVPGPEATPSTGAFEAASGPSGPASNTAKPAARYMPPAFPQSTPAAASQGFIAKAAKFKEALAKADGAEALLAEFSAMLDEVAEPGDGDAEKKEAVIAKDEGWPNDMATEEFMDGKEIKPPEDFGTDPGDLGRGKQID